MELGGTVLDMAQNLMTRNDDGRLVSESPKVQEILDQLYPPPPTEEEQRLIEAGELEPRKARNFNELVFDRDWLITPKMYKYFKNQPEGFNDELHDKHCLGGVLRLAYADGQTHERTCPRCAREHRLNIMGIVMKKSGIDSSYLEHTWDSMELDIGVYSGKASPFRQGMFYAQQIHEMREQGVSLIIHGARVGVGKTLLSVMIAKDAVQAGYEVRVTSLARECVKIREGYNQRSSDALSESALIELLVKPDFLFLDDLGADYISEHKIEARVLGHVLDTRHMAKKPTIITSNRRPYELEQGNGESKGSANAFAGYGVRTMDRLEPWAEIYIDHSKSFRTEKGDEVRESFGIRPSFTLDAA